MEVARRVGWDRGSGAAALAVTLIAGAGPAFASQVVTVPVLAILAAVLWWSHRHAPEQLRDATIVVTALWLFLAVPSPAVWPLPGLAAVLLGACWAWRRGRWRLWRRWLRIGRIDLFVWAMWATTAVVSVAGLVVWNRLFDGELPQTYRELSEGVPAPLAMAGALTFLVVNGAIEDSIWCGVLLNATERPMPAWSAVTVVAISFGLAHLHGVPGGPVGVVLAGSWGLVLALLRVRTGGMGATYLAHIVADTTIVLMLLPAHLVW